jgi:hypothetical protein
MNLMYICSPTYKILAVGGRKFKHFTGPQYNLGSETFYKKTL